MKKRNARSSFVLLCRTVFGDGVHQPLAGGGEVVSFKASVFQTIRAYRGRSFCRLGEFPHHIGDTVFFQEIDPDIGFFDINWDVAGIGRDAKFSAK